MTVVALVTKVTLLPRLLFAGTVRTERDSKRLQSRKIVQQCV